MGKKVEGMLFAFDTSRVHHIKTKKQVFGARDPFTITLGGKKRLKILHKGDNTGFVNMASHVNEANLNRTQC